MNVDIFATTKEKEMPQWAKFANAGDNIQGTYIGKIVGAIDGYGNEQIVYQLLTNDGKVFNVGFGLNKKVINQEMMNVRFGQIIGFKFKGSITVQDKFGKPVKVKDYAIHQDPKIVNEIWLKDNAANMPVAIRMDNKNPAALEVRPSSGSAMTAEQKIDKAFDDFMGSENAPASEKVAVTQSESVVTATDKLAVIEKLAKDKLGVVEPFLMRDKVMEMTGVAFIPVNYDKIIQALNTIGA